MEHQSEGVTWSMTTEELFLRHFPLHQACRNGDLEKLSALLASGNAEFYEEDSFYGWSPLHWAANFGKLTCLNKLTQMGACSDVPTERTNITPVHVAADGGKGHCLSWLLQNHALINRQDYLGDTPIHKAAKKGNMECVSLLVSQGASLSLLNHSHCTPSQSAAENGHLECAQYIENAGKLQGQLDRNQCVTMQPSHLLQSQMEHDMSGMPCLNGHSSDGASPVDDGMDMSGDSPMIGVKRGRDEYCDEESFKRMRKGDSLWNINNCEMSPAQNPQYTHIKENSNGFICSKISGHSYANVPVKCTTASQNSGIYDTPLVNNNSYFPHLIGTSVEEHADTVCAQQGYDSLLIHSIISDCHGS